MSHLKEPIYISFSVSGVLPINEVLVRFPIVSNVNFPINFVSSLGVVIGAPTSNIALLVKNNGAQIGTININTNSTVTFSSAGSLVSAGNTLTIETPNNVATASDIGITLVGDR